MDRRSSCPLAGLIETLSEFHAVEPVLVFHFQICSKEHPLELKVGPISVLIYLRDVEQLHR